MNTQDYLEHYGSLDSSEKCCVCAELNYGPDMKECDSCGEKCCDECRSGDPDNICSHRCCHDCIDAATRCPACIGVEAERSEVLDVIHRA